MEQARRRETRGLCLSLALIYCIGFAIDLLCSVFQWRYSVSAPANRWRERRRKVTETREISGVKRLANFDINWRRKCVFAERLPERNEKK